MTPLKVINLLQPLQHSAENSTSTLEITLSSLTFIENNHTYLHHCFGKYTHNYQITFCRLFQHYWKLKETSTYEGLLLLTGGCGSNIFDNSPWQQHGVYDPANCHKAITSENCFLPTILSLLRQLLTCKKSHKKLRLIMFSKIPTLWYLSMPTRNNLQRRRVGNAYLCNVTTGKLHA